MKYVEPLMGGIWDGDGLLQVILRPSYLKAERLSSLGGIWQ